METLIWRFILHIAPWWRESELWKPFYFVLIEAGSCSSQYRQKKCYCILGDWSSFSISLVSNLLLKEVVYTRTNSFSHIIYFPPNISTHHFTGLSWKVVFIHKRVVDALYCRIALYFSVCPSYCLTICWSDCLFFYLSVWLFP